MSHQVFLHVVWQSSVRLAPEVVEKLVPYVTRYAQTFKASVLAVGARAEGDALHLLVQLPDNLTISALMTGLQTPSARYAATALGATGLVWADAVVSSISPWEVDEWQARIAEGDIAEDGSDAAPVANSDALPDWLQEALERKTTP